MATVGEKLKKAREKKHFSLEQVSQKTRIHPKILEAIEEDRAHHYLNKVYIKGFLKSYAQLVGLSEEEALQDYPLETVKNPLPTVPSTFESASWEEETGVSPWVGRSLLLIFVLGVLFLFGIGISKIKEKKVALPTPPSASRTANHRAPTLSRGVATPYPFRISPNEPLKLKLRANDNTWITVSADEHLMYQGLLTKGKEEIWTAKQDFELSLSDGGAITFNLNKKTLGVPGEKGRPLEKLVLTHEGWRLREKE